MVVWLLRPQSRSAIYASQHWLVAMLGYEPTMSTPGTNEHQNVYDDPDFFSAYQRMRLETTNFNINVEQPAMAGLLPPLHQARVVDLGCGDGGLTRLCLERGASTVSAVDISERMLAEARSRTSSDRVEFIKSSIEDFTIDQGSADVVLSSLALHYVEDFDHLAQQIAGWLRPGGWLLFSIEHPVVTAGIPRGYWHQSGDVVDHWVLDYYAAEGRREQDWMSDAQPVVKFHRTLSSTVNALIVAGFELDQLAEPVATSDSLKQHPELDRHSRRPGVLLVRARVPVG